METEPEIPEETEPEERIEVDGMIRSYLTGQMVDVTKANRRPLAIMMSNDKESLPQYGINRAGVVYEAPVEGEMNCSITIAGDSVATGSTATLVYLFPQPEINIITDNTSSPHFFIAHNPFRIKSPAVCSPSAAVHPLPYGHIRINEACCEQPEKPVPAPASGHIFLPVPPPRPPK